MKDNRSFLEKVLDDSVRGVKGYLKAQIIMMLVTFLILAIGLNLIGIKYAFLIAAGIAIVDIIPVVGSGIIMLPWSVIKFIQGDSELGFKIAVLYVVLAILRQVIEPQVTGKQIGLRPIYTFLATILGSLVLGPFGVILGPVIAILGNSIYRRRLEYYEDK